jgi:flagellar biosynthetic protein FliQ
MTDSAVLDIVLQVMIISAKLSAPLLITALAIGFAVSLFQSVTHIQEATLSFVPKAVGVGVVLLITGHWMLGELTSFTTELFARIPDLLSQG